MAQPRIKIVLDVDDKGAARKINNFYVAANKATKEAVTLSRNAAEVTKAESQAQSALNREMKTEADLRGANARALMAENRLMEQQIRIVERNIREQEKANRAQERANRPKRSAFANAILTSRFTLPGTGGTIQPLIGQSAKALGIGDNLAAGLAIGGGVAGLAGVAFLEQGKKAVGLAADMEQGLNQLEFQAKATKEEMVQVAKTARDLGGDITLPATSSVDATSAMLVMSKAGFSLKDSMDSARGSLALAAAAETDAGTAAEITASQLKAFGLAGSEAGRVADLLAAGANSSLAEIGDMALAAQQASSVFAQAKIPIEDMVTAIALMANAGIKGSDAGTSLRVMLGRLNPETEEAAAEFEKLGIKAYDSEGKMKSFREIVRLFSEALKDKTDQEQKHSLQVIFGEDAQRAANIVLTQGTKAYDDQKTAVQQVNSALDTAASKNKGLKGAIDGLNSSLDTFQEKHGSKFLNFLTDVVKLGSGALDFLDRYIERYERLGKLQALNNPDMPRPEGWEGHTWEAPGAVARAVADTASENLARFEKDNSAEGLAADVPLFKRALDTFFKSRNQIGSAYKPYGLEPEVFERLRERGFIASDNPTTDNPITRDPQKLLDILIRAQNAAIKDREEYDAKRQKERAAKQEEAEKSQRQKAAKTGAATTSGGKTTGTGTSNDNGAVSAEIIRKIGDGVRTPKGLASCAYFASEVIQQTGREVDNKKFPTIASARGLEQFVKSQGAKPVTMAQAKPGDLIGMPGNGASGRHVGIYLGNGKMMDSSGDGPGNQRVKNAPRNGTFYSLDSLGAMDSSKATSAALTGETRAERAREKAEREREKAQREAEAAREKAEQRARNVAANRADTRQTRLQSAVDVASGVFSGSMDVFETKGTMATLEEDRQRLVKESNAILRAEIAVIRDRFESGKARRKDESELEYTTRRESEEAQRNVASRKARAENRERVERVGQVRAQIIERAEKEAGEHAENYQKQEEERAQKRVELYDQNLNLLSQINAAEGARLESALRGAKTYDTQISLIDQLQGNTENQAVIDYTRAVGEAQSLPPGEARQNALKLAELVLRNAFAAATEAADNARKVAIESIPDSDWGGDYINIPVVRDTDQRSSVLGVGADKAVSRAGDFAYAELDDGGRRMASAFLESLISGRGSRRGGFGEVAKGIGQDIGRDLAREASNGLVDAAEASGKKLFKYLMDGGNGAAKAIGTAALYLQSISLLSGQQGKKKQKSGFLGGLLGLAVGSLIPGGNLLTDAALGTTLGGSLFGGMFEKGGTAPGRKISVFGERGPELAMPEQDLRIFTNAETGNLARVLKGNAGSGGGPVYHKDVRVYIDKVENRADVDRVREVLDDERQLEAGL